MLPPFWLSYLSLRSVFTCYIMPKAKFVSQGQKKQKFYGNRFTNRRNYDVKRGLDEENSSACLEDEINSSSTQVDNKAKETLSASYCKLKSVTEGNNPLDKPKKVSYMNI